MPIKTRHRASTSMYSLTFCVRFLLPERHQWKSAVQTAAVMLRTPPVGGRSPPGRPRPFPVCGARFWGRPLLPAGRRSPAGGERRPRPASRLHYVVISRDGRKLVTIEFALCCHSNATRAPIANPPNSAQLGAVSTTPPSYIRVREVVWAYGRGQTDRLTDTHTDT